MDAHEIWLEATFIGAALSMLLCATASTKVVLFFRVHAALQRSMRGPEVLRYGNGKSLRDGRALRTLNRQNRVI